MPETPQEVVDRVFREHKRYTGDGLPNEPVGAPLPVGDPQSGANNPKKVDMRLALRAPLDAAQSAFEDANRAETAADRGQTYAAMLSADKVRFNTVPALLSDKMMSYDAGDGLIEVGAGDRIRADIFDYEVTANDASDHHVETAGGVKLHVLPVGGEHYADAWGALADDATDNADALDMMASKVGESIMRLGKGVYRTSRPFYLGRRQKLIGLGSKTSSLYKTTAAVGSGSNTARNGAFTDSYAKNAIIIMPHPDNGYTYNSGIKGVLLQGPQVNIDFGIYAPRTALLQLEDVEILGPRIGFYTHDTWMCSIIDCVADGQTQRGINGNNYGWPDDNPSYGFWWDNDGSDSLTGTSNHITRTWARQVHNGFIAYGLQYSTLSACGADYISYNSYYFWLCKMTLDGCGTEFVNARGGVYRIREGRCVMNACQAQWVTGAATASPATSVLMVQNGANVTCNSCDFENYQTPNNSYNLIVENSSFLTTNGSRIPGNGITFIIASASRWHRFDTSGYRMYEQPNPHFVNTALRGTTTIGTSDTFVATLPAAGSYLMSAYVNNGGDNLQQVVLLVFDGANSTRTTLKAATGLTISVSGSNVRITVPSGSQSVNWSLQRM